MDIAGYSNLYAYFPSIAQHLRSTLSILALLWFQFNHRTVYAPVGTILFVGCSIGKNQY